MKITKEQFDKLYSDNISKKEYDNIISSINQQVDNIWNKLCKISKRKLHWWAFENDVDLGNGNGSTGGEFDPNEYKEFIPIIGEVTRIDDGYYEYDDGFPTDFLFDDGWENKVINNIEESKIKRKLEKEQSKLKREELKIRKNKFREIIESKLTQEELKYIEFK